MLNQSKANKTWRTASKLQSKLQSVVSELGTDGELLLKSSKVGRKPRTAYRTNSELIIAQTAPVAALIQAKMLRGELAHNDSVFRCCDLVLDRVCGKARQQLDLTANDEGIRKLEEMATRIQSIRYPELNPGITVDTVAIDAGIKEAEYIERE